MFKVCPFCGSNKIDVSIKVLSRKNGIGKFHAFTTCKFCHSQGPRIVFHATNEQREDRVFINDIKVKAEYAWNIRRLMQN